MRKNRTKHEAKKPRLAKRALALCFALIFVCSCLLPVFAHSEENLLAGTQEIVAEQKDEKLTNDPTEGGEDSALLNEGGTDSAVDNTDSSGSGTNPTEGGEEPKPAEQESKADEPKNEEPKTEETKPEEQPKNEGTTESKDSTEQQGNEQTKPEEPKTEGTTEESKDTAGETKPAESKPTTNTTGDTINQGEATYTYRFWPDKIDALDLEAINDAVKNGESLNEAAKTQVNRVPCTVLTVKDHAYLGDYKANVQQPTNDGYEFKGWYTIENGTNYDFSLDQNVNDIEESKIIDVFAKWEKVESTVEDEMEKTEPTTEDELEKTEPGKANESKEETLLPVEKTGAVGLANNDGDTVSIAVKAENLPGKVNELVVTDLNDDDAFDAFESAFGASNYAKWNVTNLMVNITPKDAEGNAVEPNEAVTVHFSGLESLMIQYSSEMNLKVLHVKQDGTLEALSLKNVQTKETQEGTVLSSFAVSTTSFSPFVLAADLGETAEAKQIKEVKDVSIVDDTVNSGRFILKANIDGTICEGEDAGKLLKDNGYTITWSVDGRDITYGRVTLDNGNQVENSAQNGGWVNVSYTYPNGSETTKVTYTVTVKKDGVTIPNGSAREETKYYKQLMNGSFEDNCTNYQSVDGAPLFNVEHWSATENNDKIEVIGVNGISYPSTYFGYGSSIAYGSHAAELNATQAGTLYQKVLTVPGQTLNWNFCHRARTTNINEKVNNGDTMAMLIVPEALAEKITAEKGVAGLREQAIKWGRKVGSDVLVDVTYGNKTYKIYVAQHESEVTTVTTDRYGMYKSSWADVTGSLTVPKDWYVVRFFFVAVDTCGGNPTVGNILDNVWFGQGTPPVEGLGEATVKVTKKVYGLDDLSENKAKELLNNSNFIENVGLKNWTRKTDGDGVYYEASFTETKPMFYTDPAWSPTYKEVLAKATLDGYTLKSAKAEYDGSEYTAQNGELAVTAELSKDDTKTIVFTNTYTPNTLDITITKKVATGGDTDKAFKFKVTGNDLGTGVSLTKPDGTPLRREEFQLKNGESAILKGLKESHIFTIEEDNETSAGYDTTATENIAVEAGKTKSFRYKVVEENGKLVLQAVDEKTGTAVAGKNLIADGNVVVTNSVAATKLTVTKHVKVGNATAPSGAEFTFRLTVSDNVKVYSKVKLTKKGNDITESSVQSNKYQWEFKLKDTESVQITGIRIDDANVKVEEVGVDDTYYATTYSVNNGTAETGTTAEISTATLSANQAGGTTVDFTNTYSVPNLDSMTIKKVVTGAFGERTKKFTFSVTLSNDKRLEVIHSFSNPATRGDLSSFTLKHGEYVTLGDIPIGTTITVTEKDAKDYDTSATNYKVDSNKKFIYEVVADENGNAVLKSKDNKRTVTNSAITVTNDFDGTPDTGVLLDTLPYLILLAVAVAGGVLVVVRKRKHRDE